MSTAKRICLVTGVGKSTGIGYEVCRQLANSDSLVYLSARNPEAAKALAVQLGQDGHSVRPITLDITDTESVREAVGALLREHGRLDVLVNNAAAMGSYGETALNADMKAAREVFETTLFGTWQLTQALVPLLRASSHGRIVNVSSGAGSHDDPQFGLRTNSGMAASYGISKAALNALTTRFAEELRANGILVNAICPGFTATFDGGEAMGARPVADGSASVVWAANLPDDGPTGGFFRDGKPLPW